MIDFDDPANNDWLAVNQFTVVENKHKRRPDVVLFVNGLPLAVIELKNAADENATIWTAFQQLQTYKARDPGAVRVQRAAGRLRRRGGARRHAHRRARVVQALAHDRGRDAAPTRTCRSCRWCSRASSSSGASSTWSATSSSSRTTGGGELVKKMAGYHQFHAVNVAVAETLRAAQLRRAAIEWRSAGPLRGRARSPGASPATGASAWSGTRRARARA